MNNFVEIETSEAEVSIAGITAAPPTVTLVYAGKDSNNVRRSFVQQVPVHDTNLASRVLSELHPGDRMRATVVNEWYEDGCKTYLADFTKARGAEPEAVTKNQAIAIAQNENRDLSQLPLTTSVIKPILQPKRKVLR